MSFIKLSDMEMLNRNQASGPLPPQQVVKGFSLLEVMVSLLILLAIMGGLLPVFVTYRLTTVNNDVKTGAIAVSQEILDELRQDPTVEDWPDTGTLTETPNGTNISAISHSNKNYTAEISYCSDDTLCNDTTRQVTLEINHNDRTIYTIQTVYTQLE